MSRREGQKTKLLALLHILEQYSDETHKITVPEIEQKLQEQGIPSERKSVYNDIAALQAMGYAIELRRGRSGGYWLDSRTFGLHELKLLVDAVQSSRFITCRQSEQLIQKLSSLASRYQAAQLQRQVFVRNRVKNDNERAMYNIDTLCDAIAADRMVRFVYQSGKGEQKLHEVSPWQLAWEDQSYYLIAYQDYAQAAGIRHYRLDRMHEVAVLADEPRRGKEVYEQLDLAEYLRKHFEMFGGPEYKVTLRYHKNVAAAMRDRFGDEAIHVPEAGGEYFHFTAPVCLSDRFLGWVLGFGGYVEILGPAPARERFKTLCLKMASQHIG